MPASRLTPLHRRLLLLLAAALLPVVALSILGLVLLANQQRAEVQRGTMDTMRALVSAVDGELQHSVAALETLAASFFLESGDLPAFQDQARRVLRERSSWEALSVTDLSGRQLVKVGQRPGTSLHPLNDKDSFETLLRTDGPVIGYITVRANGKASLAVRVPVTGRDGNLRYVLSAIVKPESFLPVLKRQKLPQGGVVGIFDARGNIVARSLDHEQHVGKPVARGLRELLASGSREGSGMATSLEGYPVFTTFSVSESSGWGVAVGIPYAVLEAPVRRSYLVFGIGLLLSLALGAAAALIVARGITRPIAALRAAAQAVGRGEAPASMMEAAIPEIHEVAEALAAAAQARRRAEDAREALLALEQKARAEAEEANRMKDEFLAMLGHELRNPLAAISNAVHVLKQAGVRADLAQSARDIVERQVAHLARLMDDLLDVGRVMTGKIVLDRVPLELADAIRQSLATLRAAGRLERHAVSLETAPVWIYADRNRVEQIVTNLVINAVKYSPAPGAITIGVAEESGQGVLRVRDQGIGIEADLMPHVFDLFVQGQRGLDRAQGGLGIGLTLVRRLVELHGGTVSAESAGPGRGSLFTVRFPAVAAPTATPRRAPERSQPPRRVLVVEDNDDARAMLRAILEANGHAVDEAADGTSGARAAIAGDYDVAFIDIGLPGLDGYEVARRIRAAPGGRRVRLVALTGYGQPQDRRHTLEAGFDLHLIKPASEEMLMSAFTDLPADSRPDALRASGT